MRSAPFENGKQVGVWTTYDAKGKGRQIDEDEGPGLNWPARRGAVLLRSKGGAENFRQPAGSTISGLSFIAVGLGGGVQNFAVDGDGF